MDDDATYDWRTTLQLDDRQRIVNKIMETLKRHPSVSGLEGLVELEKIATRFEEKIYLASTSQSDYLRKLSMKMLTLETKPQTTGMSNTIQSNFAASAQNPPASASHSTPSQMHNQGQSQTPLPNQPLAPPHQLLSQNVQNIISIAGLQSSGKLPPLTRLTQTSVPNAAGQSTIMQSRVEQNSFGSSVSQRLAPNIIFSSASIDSTAQTEHNAVDWQEECYQKIKSMKELYLSDLNDIYQRVSIKCQQHDSVLNVPKSDQIERLKLYKKMLERNLQFLNMSKNNIVPAMKEQMPAYEKQIRSILNANRPRQPVLAQQEIQQSGGHLLSMQPQQPQEQHQQQIPQLQQQLQEQQQQQQQQQQIPQMQQQFQQLTLQQQSVQLNGGAYNFPTTTTTPQLFQVTSHLETSQHQSLLPIPLPKTITPPSQSDATSPTNVVSVASLFAPLLDKDLEKQSLLVTTAATPEAELTAPHTNQKLIYFLMSGILFLDFIAYCLICFDRV